MSLAPTNENSGGHVGNHIMDKTSCWHYRFNHLGKEEDLFRIKTPLTFRHGWRNNPVGKKTPHHCGET